MDEAPATPLLAVHAHDGQRWLPLLRRLTELCPSLVVWKNASAALQGRGDLDVVAPSEDWDRIEHAFREWATVEALESIAVCRHVPGTVFLIALDPRTRCFFELDIKARGACRGATIFTPHDLHPMCTMDSRGFRRLRPGAEGLLKLILNCTAPDGTLNHHRFERERVAELLAADPAGAQQAARLFGVARVLVLTLAEGVLRGEWRRGPVRLLRAFLRLRVAREPAVVAERLWAKLERDRPCRGIKGLLQLRALNPSDAMGLERVVRAHAAGGERTAR